MYHYTEIYQYLVYEDERRIHYNNASYCFEDTYKGTHECMRII